MHCGACQATLCTSFSMLRKVLVKDRHFSLDNVGKYLALYVNKSLNHSQLKCLCTNTTFYCKFSQKLMQYFSRFYCKKKFALVVSF